jgi:hypothetical protein
MSETDILRLSLSTLVHTTPDKVVALWNVENPNPETHLGEDHTSELRFRLKDGVVEAYCDVCSR